jgi:hypothetical protein
MVLVCPRAETRRILVLYGRLVGYAARCGRCEIQTEGTMRV